MVKILDIIQSHISAGTPFFSFEYFPPKTEEGLANLYERQERMQGLGPAFCDITWGAGGTTSELTLEIASHMQNQAGMTTMMHLTCTNMPVAKLKASLDAALAAGVTNVLALRGDPPHGQDTFTTVEGGFSCALDLVRYIRAEYGDAFGIGVAGYPEAHPDGITGDPVADAEAYRRDLVYLKDKMDAGADFVVTQLFYDVDAYLRFCRDARAVGIRAPILPGIMPVTSYAGFRRMTSFCKTRVPAHVADALEAVRADDAAVRAYGVSLATMMCQRLLDTGAPGVHLYTLNLEKAAVATLVNLGLVKAGTAAAAAGAPTGAPAPADAADAVRVATAA